MPRTPRESAEHRLDTVSATQISTHEKIGKVVSPPLTLLLDGGQLVVDATAYGVGRTVNAAGTGVRAFLRGILGRPFRKAA